MKNSNLKNLLLEKKTIVLCGSGGVGKTTLSASLALYTATLGRKVLVVTIDPAQRLANSLGITLSSERRLIYQNGKGSLYAMMLNPKRTFDALIEKYALNQNMKDVIFNNPVYKHGSEALSGSPEYMAMEKLYELHCEGDYDIIFLDTPPTKHALEFLSAPTRMINFIEENKILNMFLQPSFKTGKLGFKVIQFGTSTVLKIIERLSGSDFIHAVVDFVNAFEKLLDGFKERAKHVNEILKDSSTSFMIVVTPNIISIKEAIFFRDNLKAYSIPFSCFIINRVHKDLLDSIPEDSILKHLVNEENFEQFIKKFKNETHSPLIILKLLRNLALHQNLAKYDLKNITFLESQLEGEEFLVKIPFFERDIHTVEGLQRLSSEIFYNNL